MMRILFLVLWVVALLAPQAYGDIEIYANGSKYASMQKYLAVEKLAAQKPSIQEGLNSQQEEYIRQAAKKLGINVDLSKIKTFELGQSNISDATRHRLYVLSVENGVISALQDFYQGRRGQGGFAMTHRIFMDQLQEALQKAVTSSKDPKLLISEPGKVRIMAISPDYSQH